MLRKALLILSGNAAAAFLLLVRNLVVARLIPVADYGVAATFAILMAVVEMGSELGLKKQIVQARDGENPRFQAALQSFQLLRGIVSGVALFLLAGPMAAFFGIPEAAWAYQVLAIVPVLKAAEHFDIHRLNRQMRFGPMLWSGIIPAGVALALIWPLALWFGDWQVMLWSIVAQAGLTAIVSHLLAERPYRLAWDPTIMGASLRFGWPLMVNALLLFAVMQGDKLIVGHLLGMEILAVFAIGVMLTLTPTLILSKSISTTILPRISQRFHAVEKSNSNLYSSGQVIIDVYSCIAFGFFMAYYFLGSLIVQILLDERYSSLEGFIILLAAVASLRVMKGAPAVLSLASGKTLNIPAANIWRLLLLVPAWFYVIAYQSIMPVLFLAVAAEALGAMTGLWLARNMVRRISLALFSYGTAMASIFTLFLSEAGMLGAHLKEELILAVALLIFLPTLVRTSRYLVHR